MVSFREDELRAALYFIKNYNLITKIKLDGQEKALGDKTNKVCRFCGKTKPEVTFSKIAHAIPELIGNKNLISYYECDTCNEEFSTSMEDHLAKYLGAGRTLSQVKGKTGVPSYKSNSSRIDVNERMIIQQHNIEEHSIINIDEVDKKINFTTVRQPFTPIAVYKCFVKMALSIMPEDELQYFKNTIAWVKDKNHKTAPGELMAAYCFTPGQNPHGVITNYLYKRSNRSTENDFYMIYVVTFNNYMFQVYLPACDKDNHLLGQNINLCRFPVNGYEWGENQYDWIDFSSAETVRNNELKMSMSYQNKIEVPKEQYAELPLPPKKPDSLLNLLDNKPERDGEGCHGDGVVDNSKSSN